MVAAGDSDSVSVRTIGICAALILAGLVAAVVLGGRTSLLANTPLPKSPAVLEQRAKDVIQSLGYTEPPADRVYGFRYATDYQRYAQKEEKPATYRAQLAKGQPPSIYFWYRQSPQYLEAAPVDNLIDLAISIASPTNPPQTHVGMAGLSLDPQGQLIEFSAVPPQVEDTSVPQHPADWTALLAAAGVDMSRFAPAEPQWIPLVSFDTRAAWTGSYAHAPEVPLRIEAASWRGRPVYFQVIGPWSKPERMAPPSGGTGKVFGMFFICTLILAAFLAWRNIRLGRGDTRGAFRLAAFVLSMSMLAWLCSASHVPTAHEFVSFMEAVNVFFASAGRAWIFYVALEPYVRRRWPQIMITWSRLLGGGVRDPLVGGHVLIGITLGVGLHTLFWIPLLLWQQSGKLSFQEPPLATLLDARHLTMELVVSTLGAVFGSLLILLFLFVFRAMFRRLWLAVAALIALLVVFLAPMTLIYVFFDVLIAALAVFALIRFGVLALMSGIIVLLTLGAFLFAADFSAWYAGSSLFAIGSVLALTAYALYTALAGRPLFKAGFLEND